MTICVCLLEVYLFIIFSVEDWIQQNCLTFLLGYMAFNFKNKLIKSILIVLVFFIFQVQGKAQLVVNSAMTPHELVENILLGTGVTVYNIT